MAQSRESTVVGVFDEYRAAQACSREIAEEGITPEAVHFQSNMAIGAAGRGVPYGAEPPRGGLTGFFHRLFGDAPEEREQTEHYAEAVRRGTTVLAVTAPNSKLHRVVDIMNAHQAIDIEQCVEEFRRTGYDRFDPNAPPFTIEEALRQREQLREVSQSAPVPEEAVKVGKRAIRCGGVRVYGHGEESTLHKRVRARSRTERRPVDRTVEPQG